MKKDKLYYLKQCRKMLRLIEILPPNQGVVFLRLKKKAQKYLERAKYLEAVEEAMKEKI